MEHIRSRAARLARKRHDEEGFTLIELLVVIVILGVLSGVVVFAVNGILDKGKRAACNSDGKTIEVAVEAYNAQNGNYPSNATTDLKGAELIRTVSTYVSDTGPIIYDPAKGTVDFKGCDALQQ